MTDRPTRRCTAPECAAPPAAKGLCRRHYWLHRRDALAAESCGVEGCDRPLFCTGLCRGHYARKQRGATVSAPLLQRPPPGLTRLVCRIPPEVHARLMREAEAANVSPSILAGQLLAECLGILREAGC